MTQQNTYHPKKRGEGELAMNKIHKNTCMDDVEKEPIYMASKTHVKDSFFHSQGPNRKVTTERRGRRGVAQRYSREETRLRRWAWCEAERSGE